MKYLRGSGFVLTLLGPVICNPEYHTSKIPHSEFCKLWVEQSFLYYLGTPHDSWAIGVSSAASPTVGGCRYPLNQLT